MSRAHAVRGLESERGRGVGRTMSSDEPVAHPAGPSQVDSVTEYLHYARFMLYDMLVWYLVFMLVFGISTVVAIIYDMLVFGISRFVAFVQNN